MSIDAGARVDAGVDATPVEAPVDGRTSIKLVITTIPPDAAIVLDGEKLGRTPFEGTVPASAGTHVMKIRLRGYDTIKLDIQLDADITQEIRMEKLK